MASPFLLAVAIVIGLLGYCFFNDWKKRQRSRRLFRPLTRFDGNDQTHDRGEHGDAIQLFPSALTTFGLRADGGGRRPDRGGAHGHDEHDHHGVRHDDHKEDWRGAP